MEKNLRRRIQRFLRGYSWSDVWNLDGWFIETVEPMLRHLQKEGVGTPLGYEKDEMFSEDFYNLWD